MKTTFTLEQVKELLALTPAQQQQIIDYGDMLAAASDDEIAASAVDDDAPEMIRDIHRRSVRRASAAVSRRKRCMKPQADAGDERLSHSAERRLQWFRDTVLPQIDREIRNSIAQVRSAFSTLSPGQMAAVSRRAYNLLIKNLLQIMLPLCRPEL